MGSVFWIGTGMTESGDDVGPYLWDHKPDQEDIQKVLLRDIPDEVEAECISWDGIKLTQVVMEQ